MKRNQWNLRRVLALALCLCMVLTLLPMSVLAEEEPASDVWVQVESTVTSGSVCAYEDGVRHLKSTSSNDNASNPAVFINQTANAAIQASDADTKFVQVTFTPVTPGDETRFALYLRYTDPTHGFCFGYNPEGWFWESYGTDGTWGNATGTPPAAGEETVLRLEWSNNQMKAIVNGTTLFENISMTENGAADTVAFRLASYSVAEQISDIKISDFDYTGRTAGNNGLGATSGGGEPTQPTPTPSAPPAGGLTDPGDGVPEGSVATDGISADTWRTEHAVSGTKCEYVEDKGYRELYAGASNDNGANAAMFINETASAAIYAQEGGADKYPTKFVEITFEPVSDASNSRFGVYLNYTDNGNGMFVGYDGYSKWYWQKYSGGSGSYDVTGASTWVAGQDMTLRLVWNDSHLHAWLNGQQIINNMDITAASSAGKAVAIKCSGWSNEDTNRTHVYLKSMHYSGQESVAVRSVSGKVTDTDGAGLAGVTVTIGRSSATTDASGNYTVENVPAGTYTATAEKVGYDKGTKNITITDANLTGQNFSLEKQPVISGKVTVEGSGRGVAGATVAFYKGETLETSATTGADGSYSLPVSAGTYTVTVSAAGYATKTQENYAVSADATLNIVTQESLDDYHVLETAGMQVLLLKSFPQVVEYRMKGDLAGKIMTGQKTPLNTIKINGINVTPTITSVLDEGGKSATYTMVIDNSNTGSSGVHATITAKMSVGIKVNNEDSEYADNALGFTITDVVYAGADAAAQKAEMLAHPVKNIEIPNHSLVSVDSTQAGAGFSGGKIGNSSVATNDRHYLASQVTGAKVETYFAGFVYNDDLAAGISTNSEYAASGSAGSANFPVRLTTSQNDAGVETFALDSTKWYYNYDLRDSHPAGDYNNDIDALTAEQKIYTPKEKPWVKVVITGDANNNGSVNWQDGAIALRETVMHVPNNSTLVRDAVNTRISMNFGSQAQNPFLIALDNVKRVALHTDGLGQAVLLKGYAGEGHDSNHPDYGDIGTRMGGAADMRTMIEEGKELGAYFGIHVNASELYAESKATSENILRRNSSGGLQYGWNWIDQGLKFSALYDFGSGERAERWDDLFEAVGANDPTPGGDAGLEFVYVDVWGNYTGGKEDDWQTRRLSEEITGHGWRLAHEWSWANPYEATFQHWTADYTYGNYSDKGQANSPILRFMLNSYRDSFPADFATFGGACNAPLLGGPAMQGFEGWQADAEYDLSIYNTYNQMVATKFLQHYNIVEWTNASNAVTIPYSQGANGARGTDAQWTPEMQIRLKSDDGRHEVVVTRGLDSKLDTTASFSLANEVEYRSRVITLDGVEILRGAPASAGEDMAFPKSQATLQYLIPWYWDNEGQKVSSANEKLYHWNAKGGTSTWELPKEWQSLGSVIMYELSDQGRGTGKVVNVVGGKVTFVDVKANTGYVVVKGAENQGPQFSWSTGLHVEDASFNVDTANGPWSIEGKGTATRVNSTTGISVLKMAGEVSVSQEMNGLKPNTNYVAYVGVDNRSEAAATFQVKKGELVLATNYTGKSIAKNYVSAYALHNGKGVETGDSYFQNMYLFFTTPADVSGITMVLSREAGAGATYWDDVRVLETEAVNFTTANGLLTFTQDFEHVAQGQYPFVVGPLEGVNDNRQHLSELNAPFTQAGWDVKKLDDVIEGKWSIKVNGLAGYNNLVMQTIPQNFRFEPGKTYTVEFDYEMGSAGSYKAVVGEGAYTYAGITKWVELEKTLVTGTIDTSGSTTAKARVGHASFTVTGAASGQTWVGIYSANAATPPSGIGNDEANFGGYKDFVLDNLVISESAAETADLSVLVDQARTMNEDDYTSDNFASDWAALQTALTAGQAALENPEASAVAAAKTALENAINALTKVVVTVSGTITGVESAPVAGATVILESEGYIPVDGYVATTDAQGRFSFESMGSNPLSVANYKVKVQTTGYNVKTAAVTGITKTAPDATVNVALEAEAPGAYVNDFNNGDVSMMGYLVPDDTEGVPTIEAENGAMKITWNAASGETRHVNNVVDKSVQFVNGSMSFDVTPLSNDGLRFGVTFRGQEGTASNAARVFVGQEDTAGKWFVEYWSKSGNSSYISPTVKEIALAENVTRNVRVVTNDLSFTIFVDGVQIYNVTITNAADVAAFPMDAGWGGFNMRGNAGTQYIIDNIRIVSADETAAGTYSVAGSVTDGENAIAGVTVSVLDSKGEHVTSTTTNAAGLYKTPALEPGKYTLKVEADYYAALTESVTITSADITGKNLTMRPDATKLQNFYNAHKNDSNADGAYTEESFAALTAALAQAKAALEARPLSVAAMSAAYDALAAALEGLEAVEEEDTGTDFSALRAVYNEYAVKEKPEGKTDASWEEFRQVLANAYAVLSNANATQAEVDAAAAAIPAAWDAMEDKVSEDASVLDALQAAYDAASKITNTGYTEASWAAFEAAREAAAGILSNPGNYTAKEVTAATNALKSAQSGLRKSGGGTTPSNPAEPGPSAPVTPTSPSTSTTVDEETGTVTETTVLPDGSKGVTETTADGDVTAEVKLNNKPGDSVTLPVSPLPADSSVVTVDPRDDKNPVNITIPVEDPAPGMVAVIVHPDGTEEVVAKSVTDEEGVNLTIEGDTTIKIVDRTPDFVDVPDGYWAEDYIDFAASRNLFKGTSAITFSPTMPMNRAMLVTVLYRMEQEPDAGVPKFSDVPNNAWYTEAVGWASENDIVRGTGTGFEPDNALTRETMVLMLYRYVNKLGVKLPVKSDLTSASFAGDGAKVSAWAKDAVDWAIASGIITGRDARTLAPQASASRAEVATMLQRLVNGLNGR